MSDEILKVSDLVVMNLEEARDSIVTAALAWREAEAEWEQCRLVQGAGHVRPIMERLNSARSTLRLACDRYVEAQEK